jgi:ribose 5-phosphate isomerase B
MRVALGSDHAGFELRQRVGRLLAELRVPYEDVGCPSPDAVDYPDIAEAVARRVASGTADRGILICGTGIGMAIAANKIRGVRAAPCYSVETAVLARGHNDLNVLTLGARVIEPGTARAVVRAFLDTPFDGGRHQRRIDEIAALERSSERDPTPSSS